MRGTLCTVFCFVVLAYGVRGQDYFNLEDAVETTQEKGLVTPKAEEPAEKPKPQPGGGGGGTFGDSDLGDGELPPHDPNEHKPSGGGEQNQGEEKQSVIAGVVSAIAVAAVGAVSSFIAYQKKKLCFKGNAEDPENVNMDSHKVEQAEPQVQSSLLVK